MSNEWLKNITEKQPKLNAAEKRMRENFVDQYILDYDPKGALLRMGYQQGAADQLVDLMMNDSFVLNKIEEAKVHPTMRRDRRIQYALNGLTRQAEYYGPGASHAARVSALKIILDDAKGSAVDTVVTIDHEKIEDIVLSELSQEEFEAKCRERGIRINVPTYDSIE